MASASTTRETIINFASRYRTADDYLYLLVDGLAECAGDHPLNVSSLIRSLGEAAVTRVLRPDMSHSPEACPALVQLAAPGEAAPQRYLESSADYADRDLAYNERYVCAWLASPKPLEAIASHIAAQCQVTTAEDGWPSPWYEPLRLELLIGAMNSRAGDLLDPIRFWLFPVSWGGNTLLRSSGYPCTEDLGKTARQTQQLAPETKAFLGLWRHALQFREGFAPWRWTGASVLPPQAAVHGFRLIREAQRFGLKGSDLISLSLHQVFMHPHLPQHPDIQKAIAQARTGAIDLQSHFASYSDATWKRIVAELPRAEDYS